MSVKPVILPTVNEFDFEITQISETVFSFELKMILGGGGGTSLTAQTLGDTINGSDEIIEPFAEMEFTAADPTDLINPNIAKRITWATIYQFLLTSFNLLYAAVGHNHDSAYSAAAHGHNLSALTDDSTHRLVTDTEKGNFHAPGSDNQDLSNLVRKVTGSSLVADTEIAKIHALNADAETTATIGTLIHNGTNKHPIIDADEIAIWNSVTSLLARVTWANIKLSLDSIYDKVLTFNNGLTRTSNTITNDLITGKAGSQTVIGGTAASENLTLSSTTNATKGKIIAVDEFQNNTLASVVEKVITTNTTPSKTSGQLEAGIQTANLFITNTTLLTAIILETNWILENYSGTTESAIEGQMYIGTKFLYIYQNSVFTRYPISTNANINRIKASVVASSTLNVTDTIISTGSIANGIKIDANTLVAGSSFNIYIFGTCTSTNADVSTFTGRIGINNVIGDAAIFTYTITSAGSGTAIAFCLKFRITVRTIGATASIFGHGELINEGTTGIYTANTLIKSMTSVATHDSRNLNYFNISYVSAANTTTCTFQNVILEQIK